MRLRNQKNSKTNVRQIIVWFSKVFGAFLSSFDFYTLHIKIFSKNFEIWIGFLGLFRSTCICFLGVVFQKLDHFFVIKLLSGTFIAYIF